MIRLRRLPERGRFRRRRVYEIEFPPDESSAEPKRVVTITPATTIDKYLGVGDAWALIDAANQAWDGENGEWVTLFEER
jgi:hypothetical protein